MLCAAVQTSGINPLMATQQDEACIVLGHTAGVRRLPCLLMSAESTRWFSVCKPDDGHESQDQNKRAPTEDGPDDGLCASAGTCLPTTITLLSAVQCAVPRFPPAVIQLHASECPPPHSRPSTARTDVHHDAGSDATSGTAASKAAKTAEKHRRKRRKELNDGERDMAKRHAAVRNRITDDTAAVVSAFTVADPTELLASATASKDEAQHMEVPMSFLDRHRGVLHSTSVAGGACPSTTTSSTVVSTTATGSFDFPIECTRLRHAGLKARVGLRAGAQYHASDLLNRVVTLAAPQRACLVDIVGVGSVAVPAGARFVCSDVALSSSALTSLGEKFDLIVADPPWHNKSAARGSKYALPLSCVFLPCTMFGR